MYGLLGAFTYQIDVQEVREIEAIYNAGPIPRICPKRFKEKPVNEQAIEQVFRISESRPKLTEHLRLSHRPPVSHPRAMVPRLQAR